MGGGGPRGRFPARYLAILRVNGLGFRVRVSDLGLGISDLGFRVARLAAHGSAQDNTCRFAGATRLQEDICFGNVAPMELSWPTSFNKELVVLRWGMLSMSRLFCSIWRASARSCVLAVSFLSLLVRTTSWSSQV